MLYIKMMSNEDMADSNSSKEYCLVPVESNQYLEMRRFENGEPYVIIKTKGSSGGMEFRPAGNTYVIENGKTISTFSYSKC